MLNSARIVLICNFIIIFAIIFLRTSGQNSGFSQKFPLQGSDITFFSQLLSAFKILIHINCYG